MNPFSLQMPEMQEDRRVSCPPSGSVVGLAGRCCCVKQADRLSQSVVLSAMLGALLYKGDRGPGALKERERDFLDKEMHQLEMWSGL